jgi:hypothetical protein
MIRFLPLFAILAAPFSAFAAEETPTPAPPPAAATDPTPEPTPPAAGNEAAARRGALELAGAFSNDGYKIRDGFWFSSVEADKPALIKVNLFAGNEYWFCANGVPPARELDVIVFDSTGNVIDQQEYHDGVRAAVGVEPPVSGEYFIQVSLTAGDKSDFCLLYCYK